MWHLTVDGRELALAAGYRAGRATGTRRAGVEPAAEIQPLAARRFPGIEAAAPARLAPGHGVCCLAPGSWNAGWHGISRPAKWSAVIKRVGVIGTCEPGQCPPPVDHLRDPSPVDRCGRAPSSTSPGNDGLPQRPAPASTARSQSRAVVACIGRRAGPMSPDCTRHRDTISCQGSLSTAARSRPLPLAPPERIQTSRPPGRSQPWLARSSFSLGRESVRGIDP